MSALQSLPVDDKMKNLRTRTPSPSRHHKHRDFKRSHSQGSSPQPLRFPVQFAKAQAASATPNGAGKQSHSPFLARAARYSEGNNVLISGSTPSPEADRRQKSKNFLKKNFLINRLRSGSWHASSGSGGTKPLEARRVSEGSGRTLTEKTFNPKELEIPYEHNELGGLIHHILESHLWNVEFDQTKASELCGLLSKVLEKSFKSRLSGEGRHFKISAIVYMAEVKDDGMKMATQCAWEPTQDYFAMATYETDTIFVSAMVFAVLFNGLNDC